MPSTILDHVSLVASDLAKSLAFYDGALAPLGIKRCMDFPEAVGYGGADGFPSFWVIAGEPVTTGVHVAFTASSREIVEQFFGAALGAGGSERHAPRVWSEYHPTYYGAFVNDPDGNNIEAVHHG